MTRRVATRQGFDRGVALGILLLATIIAGIAISSYLNTRRLWTDADRAARSRSVLDAVGVLRGNARKLQTELRTYLFTGDPQALRPYAEAAATIRLDANTILLLTSDDPEFHSKAEEVQREVEKGLADVQSAIAIRQERGLSGVIGLASTRGVRSFIDPLLDKLSEFDEAEREQLASQDAKTRDAYSRAVVYGVVTAGLGLFGVALFAWLLRQSNRARANDLANLSQQRELLNATLTSIGDGVIATDEAGLVIFLNTVAEKLTGWTDAEARGLPLEKVYPLVNQATRTALENPALRAMREGTTVGLSGQTLLMSKDGTERPVDETAAPIRSRGAIGGAVLVFRDIGERKRAEDERGRLAESLGLAHSAADLGTWVWDPKTDLISLSDRAAEIYNLPAGKSYTREWMRSLIHPDYQTTARAAAAKSVAERADYDLEYPLIRSTGRPVWAAARGRGVYAPDGTLIRMLGVVQNITARKEAEHEREALLTQLREQDRRKDEFLATLAHELRNPLAPVRNSVEVLRKSFPSYPRMGQTLDVMERQLAHMVHLVDDLMDASRVSSGKIVLRRERVSLLSAVESATEAMRESVAASGHLLVVNLPDKPIYLDADRTRLAQILTNLLNNAVKYTLPGGRIAITAERHGGEVVIRVTDSGVGIPADMLPKIFDLFTQIGTSLDRSQGGLGIGLTLVRKLVELHGGRVEARSGGLNCGSEFVLHLPLGPEPEEVPQPRTVDRSAQGSSLRVMIVDDNRDAAESLALLLGLMGYEVTAAHDGPAALLAGSKYRPDVVLLDLGMPGMNGYEVAARMRQSPELRQVTLVALTGWGSDDDRRKTKQAGFDHHLVKPADLATLEKVLSAVGKSTDVTAPLESV